jgi:hypothetical protein
MVILGRAVAIIQGIFMCMALPYHDFNQHGKGNMTKQTKRTKT